MKKLLFVIVFILLYSTGYSGDETLTILTRTIEKIEAAISRPLVVSIDNMHFMYWMNFMKLKTVKMISL